MTDLHEYACVDVVDSVAYLRAVEDLTHALNFDAYPEELAAAARAPRLEMFSRCSRLSGWDYWGDQSLGTAMLDGEAA